MLATFANVHFFVTSASALIAMLSPSSKLFSVSTAVTLNVNAAIAIVSAYSSTKAASYIVYVPVILAKPSATTYVSSTPTLTPRPAMAPAYVVVSTLLLTSPIISTMVALISVRLV